MRKFLDVTQSIFEYLVSLLFIYGGVSLIGMPPLEGEGVIVLVFGGQIALYIYMIWFILLGVGLIFSKWAKKKKLHKNVLMSMYLTTIYTATLATALLGFDIINILDDIVVGVVTAAMWLRWKLLTEYIDPNQFYKEIEELRDDLPPTT